MTDSIKCDINNSNEHKWSMEELTKFLETIKHGEYVCKKQDGRVIQVKITESKKL